MYICIYVYIYMYIYMYIYISTEINVIMDFKWLYAEIATISSISV